MSHRSLRTVAVIPARIGSTRLHRKALLEIEGLPMVIHVLKRVQMSPIVDLVIVATDSEEIRAVVESYGGTAVMTSPDHTTGIERTEEAVRNIDCDIVVLVNGDEAALNPDHIEASVEALVTSDAPTSLLASPFRKRQSYSDFKVTVNLQGEAMYFSREDIPSPSRSGTVEMLKAYHLISFRKPFLSEYVSLPKTPMERIEGHDHLRMLENGIKVQIGIVDHDSISVDTLEDLQVVRDQMRNDPIFAKYRNG